MEPQNARGRRESGQMLILFVLMLGVLMGFVAMSIDVGLILHERRSQQNAADAAALAAVAELPESPSLAVAAAKKWAQSNGYGPSSGATVTVNTPYQGNPGAVEVIVEKNTPFIFALALGLDNIDVSARAVAEVEPPRDYAIFASAGGCEADSLNIQGSTSSIDGEIHTNSELKVNSDLYVDGAVTHVCDAAVSGANTFTEGIYQEDEISWPALANYTYADFPCTFTETGNKMKIGAGGSQYLLNPGSKTLKPGVYCADGGIDVAGTLTGNVTFVAKGVISFNCSSCSFDAYWNDVLAFTESSDKSAISFSVSQFGFQGLILAPNGGISANGSTFTSDAGGFLANTVSISASDINITAMEIGKEGPPKLVE
jgi:hypothetical protein